MWMNLLCGTSLPEGSKGVYYNKKLALFLCLGFHHSSCCLVELGPPWPFDAELADG